MARFLCRRLFGYLVLVVVASGLQTLTVRPSASGASVGGLSLGRATLRLTGDAGVVTVDQ